jgi:hypothetical protein
MFLYYGKTFESARAGGCIVGVVCDHCGCKYYFELARIGSGASTASYGIATQRASERAIEQSDVELQRRLATEAELVPCPKCNWINDELVKGYRLGRYRTVGKLAWAIGLAGSVLSLVAAWFIHVGPARDRWLLPYLLFAGPGAFGLVAIAMLLIRNWLRDRIQPNRAFPQDPLLPHGSPPALVLDEATQGLRIAKPAARENDGILSFQFGRHSFPPLCCECLQAAESDNGYSINVTRLLQLKVPMCAGCADRFKREYQRVSGIVAALGCWSAGRWLAAWCSRRSNGGSSSSFRWCCLA